MATVQKIRRYNMNDIPPGATPAQRLVAPKLAGVTLPTGGMTAISPQVGQQSAGGAGSSAQINPDQLSSMLGYAQGEFRKIKQTTDSMSDQFISDENTVANLPGRIFNFWTFAQGVNFTANGAAVNTGFPVNHTITKARSDTTLFLALQVAVVNTSGVENVIYVDIKVDGNVVLQCGQVGIVGVITQIFNFSGLADARFFSFAQVAGNHTVDVAAGTSAGNSTIQFGGANLWVWETLMGTMTQQ